VDNAVDAIINATFSDVTRGRTYNLSDGTFATWRTYLDALADGLQLRRAWINIPFSVAYRLAAALEAPYRRLRLPGRPLLTRHAVYLLGRNQEYPTGRAQSDFGFAPKVSFEEGVARTVDWLKLEHP
jgi:nucleoside-diphosphate-sugar epimerase